MLVTGLAYRLEWRGAFLREIVGALEFLLDERVRCIGVVVPENMKYTGVTKE